jgi:glycerol-3-phosphate O-acyltransferase/dihydroxyacetone phosphate acyltransferase
MWLYRAMPAFSSLATRAYYRVTVAGTRLPANVPVLIVANHNNSLVDPALVSATANRPVRYLAKAPLFTHPLIGWIIRGVGSVPVYRQIDDPSKIAQNLDSFRDAHRVLAEGEVIGIFPEGISHSAPRLAPLKTGAARIAIGAAEQLGTDFPIVAVGLVFRDRDAFRSEAHVIYGEIFRWDDLVGDATNRSAVRELTERIEQAMRRVSVNLEQWEDEPIVRMAEAIWRAEFGADPTPAAEVARLRVTTAALAALREGGDGPWRETALELKTHGRALRAVGLSPEDLAHRVTPGEVVRWMLKRLPLVPLLPISLTGGIFFWAPKQVTVTAAAWVARREGDDALVTHRVLVGGVVFPIWFVATSLIAGATWGLGVGIASLLLQPIWAFAALAVGERRQAMATAIRRYLLRRVIADRLGPLRNRQRALAQRLKELLERSAVAS